jgi:hypothetical protein
VTPSTTSICASESSSWKQLVVQRAQRMQPGDRKPRQLRGDAGAPGVGAVGGEKRDAGAGLKAHCMNTLWMRPIMSVAP